MTERLRLDTNEFLWAPNDASGGGPDAYSEAGQLESTDLAAARELTDRAPFIRKIQLARDGALGWMAISADPVTESVMPIAIKSKSLR